MDIDLKRLNQTVFQYQSQSNSLQKQLEQTHCQLISQYKQFYDSYMGQIQNLYTKQQIIQKLVKFNINYRENLSKDFEIRFTILKHTLNYEAIVLKLCYCQFQTQISLLNIQGHFQYEYTEIGAGSFGEVYLYHNSKQPSAIKNINYDRTKCTLSLILRQYFFNMLMSALECGPKLSKIFGFDLLIFQSSIAFAMELCEKLENAPKIEKKELQKSLKLIHSLNIIHGDIKPQNIVYSPFFKKLVFCDFGLTKIIPQQIGQKSYTHFFGSMMFVSPEMFKILEKQSLGYIDLYYNDLFGLNSSQIIFVKKQQYKKKWTEEEQFIVSNKFQICFQKYLAFKNQFKHLHKISKEKEFLDFILMLEPSHQLYCFFFQYFGAEENLYTKYTPQLLLREIYTRGGISQQKWQQIVKNRNLTNFKDRLKFPSTIYQGSGLSKSIYLRQLQNLLKNPNTPKQQICKNIPNYLQHWNYQDWIGAQDIIHHAYSNIFHRKLKSKRSLQKKLNRQKKKKQQQKQQQMTDQTVSSQQKKKQLTKNKEVIDYHKQLIQLLYFLSSYFFRKKEYNHLIKLAQFEENFFIKSSQIGFRFLALKILYSIERENKAKIVAQTLNYIIIHIAPLRSDFLDHQLITSINKIKQIVPSQIIVKQLNFYLTFFYNGFYLNRQNRLQIDLQQAIQDENFKKCLNITRLCIQIKSCLLKFDFSKSMSQLNQIEDHLDDDMLINKTYLKRFIKQSYIYIYFILGSFKGSKQVQQYLCPPKSFQRLWSIANKTALIKKHTITKNWFDFIKQLNEYLQIPSIENFEKLITLTLMLGKITKLLPSFRDSIMKLLHVCFKQIKFMALDKNSINRQMSYFFSYITSLYSLLTSISKDFSIKIKQILNLEAIFRQYSYMTLPQQFAKFTILKIRYLYQSNKYSQVISQYKAVENQQLPAQQKNKCRVFAIMSWAQLFNYQKASQLALENYEKLKQSNDLYFLAASPLFFNILQQNFHRRGMIKSHIQLATTILNYIYLHKQIEKRALKDFVKQITTKHSQSAIKIADHFLKRKYYVSKNISLHNFTVLLLEVIQKFNYGSQNKILFLQKISMTIDSLSCGIKTIAKPKYYRLMGMCYHGRKQQWIKNKYQTNKKKKKNSWIRNYKKNSPV